MTHSPFELNFSSQSSSHPLLHPLHSRPLSFASPHVLGCLSGKAGSSCPSLATRRGTGSQPRETPLIRPQLRKRVRLAGVLPHPHFSQLPTFSHQQLQIPTPLLTCCFGLCLLHIYFLCLHILFFFQGPLPRPAIWFSFKQSVECAEAAGGVPAHDRRHMPPPPALLPGREGLRPSCGEERGIPEKVQGRPRTSLVHFDSFLLSSY